MKGKHHFLLRTLCLLLTLLLLQPVSAISAASGLQELRSSRIELNDQLTLVTVTNYNWANDQHAVEHYFEYVPGGDVLPMVCYGPGIYGVSSAKTIFSTEAEAGNVLTGLTNGDFFVMSTGVSLGPVIRDGIVRTGGSGSVIAFGEDGSVYMGDPSLAVSLDFPGQDVSFAKINFNKALSGDNGICVFSGDFGSTNGAVLPAYNLLLRIEDGEPRLGSTMECSVMSGFESEGRVDVPEGCILLSIASSTEYAVPLQLLQDMEPEAKVLLRFSCSPEFENVQHAIGCEKWLIQDGLISGGLDGSTRAPRTAAGLRRDGSFVLYTVDGRQKGYSMGVTMMGLAQRMEELGCVQAVNLDGGASTQLFAVLPGDTQQQQINVDSDPDYLRSCANYIAFANCNQQGGTPAHLHLYPYDEYVLSGTRVELTAKATDAGYFAAEVPEDIRYTCDELGSMEDNVYIAGDRTGVGEIYARSGKAEGSVKVNIIADPDSITVYADGRAVTSLNAGLDKSYQLTASSLYRGQTLRSDQACYSWSITGDIGTIDEDGVFTAEGEHGAEGSITVRAGSTEQTISVVLRQTLPMEELQEWILELVQNINE